MKRITIFRRLWMASAITVALAGVSSLLTYAQTSGYAIGEAAPAASSKQPANSPDNSTAGPVRLARFSFIQGEVTWRADDTLDWAAGTINQPIRQGAQIAVAAGGRVEIQFDDGGYLRLGGGSTAVLQLLFSDAEGEFTEIKLTSGLGSLRLKHDRSVYQIDTPLVSVKADGPARIRVGISDGVEVGLREGAAVVEGAKGKVTMKGGDYLDLRDETSPYDLHDLPPADSWENWNDDRDQMLDDAAKSLERHQVPPDVALVAGNLDAYGTWQTDAAYGQVWCPNTIGVNWRPYFAGHWVWVNPFGWTWCSDEPWGWAPYHYGAWFHAIRGWAWRPGPAHQYWSPAVVHFTELNGNIAWCALAPNEIQYPAAISVGAFGANWPGYFSIGAAGSYFPSGAGYSVGRAFNTVLLNSGATAQPGSATNSVNGNSLASARPFVPLNAKSAAGVTVSSQAAFAGHGAFTPLIAGSTTIFTQGKTISVPQAGKTPVFGPPGVKPPASTFSAQAAPIRSSTEITAALSRPVFSSTVPKDPVRSGIAPAQHGSGVVGGVASASGSNTGAGGRKPGSTADAVAAARAALNGGRTPSGTSSGGGTNPAGSSVGTGYTSGRSTGGGASPTGGASPSGGSGQSSGSSGGHATPSVSPPAGSGSGAGSSAGHTSGGSTSGGGYHVGGGAPSGGSPVHR